MKTLIAFLLLLPALAHADLTGRYSGTGSSIFHKSRHVRPCTEIFIDLVQTASELRVNANGYVCEDLQAEADSYVLKIRDDGHLISDEGLDIGVLSGDVLTIDFTDKQENFTYRWRVEKNERVSYREEWLDAGVPALTVEGELEAQPRR